MIAIVGAPDVLGAKPALCCLSSRHCHSNSRVVVVGRLKRRGKVRCSLAGWLAGIPKHSHGHKNVCLHVCFSLPNQSGPDAYRNSLAVRSQPFRLDTEPIGRAVQVVSGVIYFYFYFLKVNRASARKLLSPRSTFWATGSFPALLPQGPRGYTSQLRKHFLSLGERRCANSS